MRPNQATLWVCWTEPREPLGPQDALLSFLPPAAEARLAPKHGRAWLCARVLSREVRREAIRVYLEVVARIGLARDGDGRTLRERLANSGQASRWWYHPVAFRDCEGSAIFDQMIALLTIRQAAAQVGAGRIVTVGASTCLVRVLRSAYSVEACRSRRQLPDPLVWMRGIGSRIAYLVRQMRYGRMLRRTVVMPVGAWTVALSGFWDWSVWRQPGETKLTDRYLKGLPDELSARGLAAGWLAWFDPHGDPGRPRRRLRESVAPLSGRQDVAVLQQLLTPADLRRAVMDARPLKTFLELLRTGACRAACRDGGYDWYPLFAQPLLRGFLDASLPHHELVSLATERACRRYQPKATVSFLEHFPYARAHYEGVRRSGGGAIRLAVQHASYSHEKTFVHLHPAAEWLGEPDGQAVPHPDYVCAMGSLGQELFLACGYRPEQVLLTGSPRYDPLCRLVEEASARGARAPLARTEAPVRLLLVAGLDVEVELEMVDAACAAVAGRSDVAVALRMHPFARIDRCRGFRPYRSRVRITQGSLREDLAEADLVLFTYSTVAEEAAVIGKPVWQWLPLGFNGSALAEAATIPCFSSVAALREALAAFPERRGETNRETDAALVARERLFYRIDGGAADRVAAHIVRLLQAPEAGEAPAASASTLAGSG